MTRISPGCDQDILMVDINYMLCLHIVSMEVAQVMISLLPDEDVTMCQCANVAI